MQNGWVKVYRDFTRWEWYSDIKIARVFFHLLLTVNHKATRWQGIVIQPGQRVVSKPILAKETGLSLQEVKRVFERLKSTGEITCQATRKFTVISIVNWRKYQDAEWNSNQHLNLQINSQTTDSQPTANRQPTTNNNDNNNKREKNEKNINYSTFLSDDVENILEKQQKQRYGRYNNVLLTAEEVSQLKARFGSGYREKLENFSHSLELKGYRYNSHYLAMLQWYGADSPEEDDVVLMDMHIVPKFEI